MSSVSQFPPPHLIEDDVEANERLNEGSTTKSQSSPLALPAPSDVEATTSLELGQDFNDESAMKFDHLGPLVVSDAFELLYEHFADILIVRR